MNYDGAYYRSALAVLLARINTYLVRWSRQNYQRLDARRATRAAWEHAVRPSPRLFAHRAWVTNPR